MQPLATARPALSRRRRATYVACATIGVIALAVLGGETSGWPFLKDQVQKGMQRAAGVPVQFGGDFRIRLLWRPTLQIEHLTLGSAAGVPASHLLDGQQVALEWRWGDIYRWRRGEPLHLRALRAGALDVQLLRLKDGRASWHIGHMQHADTGERAQPLPTVGRLDLADGHVVFDDQVLDTQLRVDVRGGEGGGAQPQASGYRADITGRYRALPVKLTLRSGSAMPLLRNEDDDANPATTPLRVEGQAGASHVLFDGQAAALMGGRHFDGVLRFAGPSLAKVGQPLGLALPETPAFNLLGRVSHHNDVWTLRAERATIGRSELAGEFRYDTRHDPPQLSGQVTGPRLLLADLGPAIGAPTGGSADLPAPVAPRPAGRVLPQEHFKLPSLRQMNADVQVAIDQLVFSTSALTPLRNLRTRVLLNDGVLELQGLNAQVAGGQLSGVTKLDGRGQVARWAAQLRFGGVDVAGWVRGVRKSEGERKAPAPTDARALRQQREATRKDAETADAARQGAPTGDAPKGAAPEAPAYLTGQLEASVDVTGSGQSTAEILSTLEGPVHVIVRDGTMSHLITEAVGLDVAQALGVLVKGDDPLPLRCARFDFATQRGVMKITRGVFDNPDSTIRVAGQLDLRTEQLALAARARPKDVSPVSLRAPVTVTGTLSHPSVGVQPSKLAARAAGAVALGALVGPLAALIPLIDPGEGDPGNPCAPNSASDAAPAQPSQSATPKAAQPSQSATAKNERTAR